MRRILELLSVDFTRISAFSGKQDFYADASGNELFSRSYPHVGIWKKFAAFTFMKATTRIPANLHSCRNIASYVDRIANPNASS